MLRGLIGVSTVCALMAAFSYSALSAEVQGSDDKYVCDVNRSDDRVMETYAKDICRAEHLRSEPIWDFANRNFAPVEQFVVDQQEVSVYRWDAPATQHQSLWRFSLMRKRRDVEDAFISLTRFMSDADDASAPSVFHLSKYTIDKVITYDIYREPPEYEELKQRIAAIIQGQDDSIFMYRKLGFRDMNSEEREANSVSVKVHMEETKGSINLQAIARAKPSEREEVFLSEIKRLHEADQKRLEFLQEGGFRFQEEIALRSSMLTHFQATEQWDKRAQSKMLIQKYLELEGGINAAGFAASVFGLGQAYVQAGQEEKGEEMMLFFLDYVKATDYIEPPTRKKPLDVYKSFLEERGRASEIPAIEAKYGQVSDK